MIAAVGEPHGAVLPGRVRFRQPDAGRWRSADMQIAGAEGKALAQQGSVDGEELGIHGW